MSKNDTKVILTFNDNQVAIILFNSIENEVNKLFDKVKKLPPKVICKGFIYDMKSLVEITSSLINEASLFTKLKINSAYVSFDTNEVEINRVELEEITLEDGIFDAMIWEKIKADINIHQIAQKHIYDIDYISWTVDGKEYKNVNNNQIAGKKLVVKALLYEVNKALFTQYKNLLNKININPVTIKPLINDFSYLTSSIKDNHHELFVYINESALSISQITGKKWIRILNLEQLGLNELYKSVAEETSQDVEYIKQILNTTGSFGNNLNSLEIINGFNTSNSNFDKIHGKQINGIMAEYAKAIVDCIRKNIEYLKNEKQITINKTTYIPNSQLTNRIINLTQLKNDSDVKIYTNDYVEENGFNYVQLEILINSIKYESIESSVQCVQQLTAKDIKQLSKGE